jgi:hypothetical protein
MAEYSFNALKSNEKAFVAMTSLNVKEFQQLLDPFTDAYQADLQARGKRLNETRGRSDGKLALMEDKLLFILFYLKTYPLQEVLAYSFGLPQSVANQWIHHLCPILQCALEKMGHKPVRLSSELMERLIEEGKQSLVIDGTERRIQRPVNDNTQKDYYSGKKKAHTVKNNVIVGADDRNIKYLGKTHSGKKHDKKIADEEETQLPEGSVILRDLGFKGCNMGINVTIIEPKKKPRNKCLTEKEKEENRRISSVRVVVEHIISGIKRCRCLKDVYRNLKEYFDDQIMEVACGLHNLRNSMRNLAY